MIFNILHGFVHMLRNALKSAGWQRGGAGSGWEQEGVAGIAGEDSGGEEGDGGSQRAKAGARWSGSGSEISGFISGCGLEKSLSIHHW